MEEQKFEVCHKTAKAGKSRNVFDISSSQRWMSGIPYEVAFWRSYYRNRRSRNDLIRWSQLDEECCLDNFDVGKYISELKIDNPIIVDVGSALSYAFGNLFNGRRYDIVYLDPLANFYNRILDDYSLDYPRITFGMGEVLSLLFGKNTVSFFHIRNALDHSVSPMSVIWQALDCLHVGGVLYLNHKPNEAEHEAYVGFHQFNVDCLDGRLRIWNKEKSIDVSHELGDYVDVKTSVTKDGRSVSVIIKKKDIPENKEELDEGREYALGLMESMLGYFYSSKNSSMFQMKKAFYSALHRCMRLMPYATVRKLKSILSGKKALKA